MSETPENIQDQPGALKGPAAGPATAPAPKPIANPIVRIMAKGVDATLEINSESDAITVRDVLAAACKHHDIIS